MEIKWKNLFLQLPWQKETGQDILVYRGAAVTATPAQAATFLSRGRDLVDQGKAHSASVCPVEPLAQSRRGR